MEESDVAVGSSILESASTLSIIEYPEDSEEIDDATTDSEIERRRETRMRLQSIYEHEVDDNSYDELLHLDYSRFKKCVVCQRPITELLVWALNKPHHCKCLTCFVCDKSVAFKKFKVIDGKLFMCYRDYYESYQKCRICQAVIGPDKHGVTLPFDKLYHEECFKCPNCYKKIKKGCSVELFDETYCEKCGAEIASKKKILRTHYECLGRLINDQQDAEVEKPGYALEEVSEELKAIVEKMLKKKS